MRWSVLWLLLVLAWNGRAQTTISGKVVNNTEEALVGASVYIQQRPETGVNTDENGRFNLQLDLQAGDTLLVSYLGHENEAFPLDGRTEFYFYVQLSETARMSEVVVVQASRALTEEFSLKKLKPIDIYLNPLAAADPLKAVATLPASTNTNETATVELRGSSQNRSIVYLNGVPVYKPVRTTTLNDLGFFSLFNTDLIDELLVYAMAPPLNFGNASSGLVDIRSIRKLPENNSSVSLSLGGMGMFLNRELGRQDRFVQVYGNYQYADAFLSVNPNSFPTLKDFNIRDVGVNFHYSFDNNWEFNLYQYFVDEDNESLTSLFANESVSQSNARRYFNVAELNFFNEKFFWRVNAGYDQARSQFLFALTDANEERKQLYVGTDASHYFNENWKLQYGLSGQFQRLDYASTFPRFFFAISPEQEHPTVFSDTLLNYNYYEAFGLLKYSNDKLNVQVGLRQHYNDLALRDPLSWQVNLAYKLSEQSNLIGGVGFYNNLRLPSVNNPSVQLLNAFQVNAEYRYNSEKFNTAFALFYKLEKGERLDFIFRDDNRRRIWGAEIEFTYRPTYQLEFRLANISLHNRLLLEDVSYLINPDLLYFLKLSCTWRPRFGTFALQVISRPGTYYTAVNGSEFREDLGVFEPLFGGTLNESQFNDYNNASINFSKVIFLGQSSLILYCNLNNMFNIQNQQAIRYLPNYEIEGFDTFQRRMVYFGTVWKW